MWKSLSPNARFSVLAFVITAALGLLSMGALGALLYYPVSFLFTAYLPFNEWHGDWVWPAMIATGMCWSVGFILGGVAFYYFSRVIFSRVVLYSIYVFILWCWAAALWYFFLENPM